MNILSSNNLIVRKIKYSLIYLYIYIYIYIYIITACVAQLANVSDIQAVGREFKPRPDH